MRTSTVILCFVVCVVAYAHAQNNTTVSTTVDTAKLSSTSVTMNTSVNPNGTTAAPSKPTSGRESSSAIFGLVLAFAFSCLVKNL